QEHRVPRRSSERGQSSLLPEPEHDGHHRAIDQGYRLRADQRVDAKQLRAPPATQPEVHFLTSPPATTPLGGAAPETHGAAVFLLLSLKPRDHRCSAARIYSRGRPIRIAAVVHEVRGPRSTASFAV